MLPWPYPLLLFQHMLCYPCLILYYCFNTCHATLVLSSITVSTHVVLPWSYPLLLFQYISRYPGLILYYCFITCHATLVLSSITVSTHVVLPWSYPLLLFQHMSFYPGPTYVHWNILLFDLLFCSADVMVAWQAMLKTMEMTQQAYVANVQWCCIYWTNALFVSFNCCYSFICWFLSSLVLCNFAERS